MPKDANFTDMVNDTLIVLIEAQEHVLALRRELDRKGLLDSSLGRQVSMSAKRHKVMVESMMRELQQLQSFVGKHDVLKKLGRRDDQSLMSRLFGAANKV